MACHLQIDADADPDTDYDSDEDPDPAYHFVADLDPAFQFDADPDPQHCCEVPKIRRKDACIPKPGSRQVLGPVEILEIVLHGGMHHLGMLYHRYVLLGKYQIISTNY